MHKVIDILKDKRNIFNTWRMNNPDIVIDLSNTDLSGLNLSGKYLMNVNLSNANLSNTICVSTVFSASNLENVSFKDANLSNAIFGTNYQYEGPLKSSKLYMHLLESANLRNANFENANLYLADFQACNMDGAILVDTQTEQANFSRAFWGGVILSAY